MTATENFNIIAFRSRQHAIRFNQILKEHQYAGHIISTPKGIAVGCGLSVRFSPRITKEVIRIYKQSKLPMIGFYEIKRIGGRTDIRRLSSD